MNILTMYRCLSAMTRRYPGLLIGALCVLLSGGAQAGCLDQKRLLGVNLSGAEFNTTQLPGVLAKDYMYPTRKDLAYFRGLGMNVIRLPVRWERIQRQTGAALDPVETEQIRSVTAWAEELDMCVLLDLHNYGSYYGRVVGSAQLPGAAFTDVWLRLSKVFDNPKVTAFGLMNEPNAIAIPQWMTIAQQTVIALRQAGATNLLIVGSGRWSGAHEWAKSFDGAVAENYFRSFHDPLNNFAIELHQYANPYYSGTTTACVAPALLQDIMSHVTIWAKKENKRLFLGEFGVASSEECLAALNTLLEGMQDRDAWLGWTYWTAGAWWGKYPFNIHPTGGPEALQLTVLRKFLPK